VWTVGLDKVYELFSHADLDLRLDDGGLAIRGRVIVHREAGQAAPAYEASDEPAKSERASRGKPMPEETKLK